MKTEAETKDLTAGSWRAAWQALRGAAKATVCFWLGLALALTVASAAVSGIAPAILAGAIDRLAAPGREGGALQISAYVILLGAGRLIDQGQAYAIALADQRLQRAMAASTFAHLLGLPVRVYVERSAGSLIQTQAMALQGVRLLMMQTAFVLAPAFVQLAVILIIVAGAFDVVLWVVIALTICAYGAAFTWGVRAMSGPLGAALRAQAASAGLRTDAITNIETIKAFEAEARLSGRLETVLVGEEQAWRAFARLRLGSGGAVALIFVASIAATCFLGLSGLQRGAISIGNFVLLNTYMLQIARPLETMGFALRDVGQAVAYLARWGEIRGIPAEHAAQERVCQGQADSPESKPGPPAIAFAHVSFAYHPAQPVLSDVSVCVAPGGSLAIVGPSGVGKSTLLRLLQRHYTPRAGSIRVDGVDIATLPLAHVRRQVAVVNQDVVLFNDTIRANLLLGNPAASDSELRDALARAGLDQLGGGPGYGQGEGQGEPQLDVLDLAVGERGIRLSGGERQRLAIARALLRNAPILLLDEPTSALDAETERQIFSSLREAMHGRTTLIVTHRLSLASLAEEILMLDRGRIVERGAHRDLVAAGGAYSRLWRIQSDAFNGPRYDGAYRTPDAAPGPDGHGKEEDQALR